MGYSPYPRLTSRLTDFTSRFPRQAKQSYFHLNSPGSIQWCCHFTGATHYPLTISFTAYSQVPVLQMGGLRKMYVKYLSQGYNEATRDSNRRPRDHEANA